MGFGGERDREKDREHQRDREHLRDREQVRERGEQHREQIPRDQSQRDQNPRNQTHREQSHREQQRERERSGRVSPPVVGDRGVLSPDNPSSDVGSEYDDVDFADEHESEGGGDINFAGVTSDLEVRREGSSTLSQAYMVQREE